MEDDERQKKLEAGKEKFAAYLKKKNALSHHGEQNKKKKNETEESRRESSSSIETSEKINMDLLIKSNGTSGDDDRLQFKVKELEDIVSGKDAALEAAYEELSALKNLSSLDVSSGMLETDYKAHLEEYHKRLQEYQEAVQDRERIIGQLSSSLQQALQTRDALQLQGDQLAQEVALLQGQLKATITSIQSHQWDTGIEPQEYLALQNKMLALEAAVNKNESVINDLRRFVKEKEDALQSKNEELEKKSQEISQHKTKSAIEIQKLMREVEELHQKCALQSSNQNLMVLEHEGQLASLRSELEENFGLQLVQIKEELRNRFNEEKEVLEEKHAKEISSCQSLIAKLSDLFSMTETEDSQVHLTSEKMKQLHKDVLQFRDSFGSKINISKIDIVDSENKTEVDKITQYCDQKILEMRILHDKECMSYKEQIESLNVRLQEASKVEETFSARLLECQQSYEMELASYKQQMDALNLRLREASAAEENFPKVLSAHKQSLESEVTQYKEENEALNVQLQTNENIVYALQKEKSDLIESQNAVIASYEKKLQDLMALLKTSEENLQSQQNDVTYFKSQFEERSILVEKYVKEIETYREQVSVLNNKLEEAQENLRLEMYNCREAHKEEINLLKQNFERASSSKCVSHEEELSLCKQQIEFLNSRLQDANEAEKSHMSQITACHTELKDYKDQVDTLDKMFNEEFSQEMTLKNQEIEALHECLKEASNSEEKYKNEIVSYQSKITILEKQLEERFETEKKQQNEIAACQEKLAAYCDQIETLKKLTETNDELEAYKEQVKALKESLQFEVSRISDSHSSQMKLKDETHTAEIASLNKQITELSTNISIIRDSTEEEKTAMSGVHEKEVAFYRQQLEELNSQLQKFSRIEEKYVSELTEYQTQLSSHKNIIESLYSKLKDETSQINELHTKEVKDLKDKLNFLENAKISLEANVAELLKQREDSNKSNQVQLEELTIQCLKLQSLLAAREEIEESLQKQIKDLQTELQVAEKKISKMTSENNQLQETTVQYLKLEGLIAGKEEMIQALTERNQQLEKTLDIVKKDCEESKTESALLSQKVAKAKELLRRLKVERDELCEKCRLLEEAASQLRNKVSSDESGENSVEKIVSYVECTTLTSEPTVTVENTDKENCLQTCESGPSKKRKQDVPEVQKPVLSLSSHKWLEKLVALENEKKDLANRLEIIELKLQEKELKEKLYLKENESVQLHCKELEERLFQLEKIKLEMQTVIEEKNDLELKVINLKKENEAFQNEHETLNSELAGRRIPDEEDIYHELKEKLLSIFNKDNYAVLEQLLLELENKAKEIIFLKVKLRMQEQMCHSVQIKMVRLEEDKKESVKRLHMSNEDLDRVRAELEESWNQQQATKNELGIVKKELALLQLQKQHIESNKSRLLQISYPQVDISPDYATVVYSVIEELAAEVEALRCSLESEKNRSEQLALELHILKNGGTTDVNSNDDGSGMLELHHKLELILKSNTELVAEKEALLDKLKNQQQLISTLQQAGGFEQVENWMVNLERQQSDLMSELRAYREQHTSLAELVGSTGILQETLYRQKQELLHKFKEKAEIEKLLDKERSDLKSAHLKIQMMEHQLLEKDKISQELNRQKRLLEEDLHEIEDRLRDQEDKLESQKIALEAEIRARDLHIQHWKLELRRKQVEMSTEQTVKTLEQHVTAESGDMTQEQRLETLRIQLDELHLQAMSRLKIHLEKQFAARELELQRNLTAEIEALKEHHREQILELNKELDSKVKEIQELVNGELYQQMGISQRMAVRTCADNLVNIKEKQITDLEDIKNSLDDKQKDVYTTLKKVFENFAEEQIALAIKIVEEQHKIVHEQEISSLVRKHAEELQVLKSKSDSQRHQELHHLRQELNKKHKDELNAVSKGLKLEFSVLKQPFDKLTRVNIHHLKQELHNDYSSSVSDCVQAWYINCQEHVEELNKQIDNVWKSHQQEQKISTSCTEIQKLLETKEQFLIQIEVLEGEILKHHLKGLQKLESLFDGELAKLAGKIDEMKKAVQEGATVASLRDQITKLEAQVEDLQNKHGLALDMLNKQGDVDIIRLQLEKKHTKEMEELRCYFEQKCADVEKRYSEEVFNQHRRKLSGSSTGSEGMETNIYYAGGDHIQHVPPLTHICDSYAMESAAKDLEKQYESEFENRMREYRERLDVMKEDLEEKYGKEMDGLRMEYEKRIESIMKDFSEQKAEKEKLELKYEKELLNMKEKMQIISAAELSSVKQECTQELDRLKQTHEQEIVNLKTVFQEELKKEIEHLMQRMKCEEAEHIEVVKLELLSKHAREIQELEDRLKDGVFMPDKGLSLQEIDLKQEISSNLRRELDEEYKNKIANLEEKHAREIEAERKLLTEQFEQVTNMLKKSTEEEQEKFVLNQKEMMSDFVKQHQEEMQRLKIQLEEEYRKIYKEKLQGKKDKYEEEIKNLKEKMANLIQKGDSETLFLQSEQQVQYKALLENDSEDTPRELLELQEKFSARYKQQLEELKESHSREVARLKEESESSLKSLSEKYSLLEEKHQLEKTKHAMQMKLGDVPVDAEEHAISIPHANLENLLKERDGLKKMTCTLRYLLRELISYFEVCENEVNNTLLGELLKAESEVSNSTLVDQAISSITEDEPFKPGEKSDIVIKSDDTVSPELSATNLQEFSIPLEQDTCADISLISKSLVLTTPGSRKVHFAPDASGIMSLIEEDRLMKYMESNKDVSLDLRLELEGCLERLKAEATAVLGLSGALPKTVQITREAVELLEKKISTLTARLDAEVKSKDELLQQTQEYLKETEDARIQIDGLRSRVAELERELGKREDVSEGYGESVQPGLVRRLKNMAQLQDKARTVISEKADDIQKSPHLQLIEELCHEGDRLTEEARKEREDLQQQVDAADKQLRATRQFLEDQAAEREQERDDFLREISGLQEQLRERDRERNEYQQLVKEEALEDRVQAVSIQTVETLEQQVKEAAALQKETDLKKEEVETELKAAVDKIWVLRDIICELENQVETKTKHEATLMQQLQELHTVLEQQNQNHQELAEELDSLRVDSGKTELTEQIRHLEEQLQKHRLHVEQFQSNSSAVKQMKEQLRDLEAVVDKKTKELESLHADTSGASCSSPSEDVSIREHLDSIRCETPESQSQSPVCLPLDELLRLQNKLQRHSRAEEVALKRIRDLEMQLKGIKKNKEEVTAERDVLQERMEEQLVKNSDLQSRLDEQRQKSECLLKEANSEFQGKVRGQELEINQLRELLENKEKQMKVTKSALEETRRIMAAQESDWSSTIRQEVETVEKLKHLCHSLNIDTSALKGRTDGTKSQMASIQLLIELLVLHKDTQVKECQKQVSQLNKQLSELSQYADPVRNKELDKMRKSTKDASLEDISPGPLRSDGSLVSHSSKVTEGMFATYENDMLFTSQRKIAESESVLEMNDSGLKELLIQKDSELMDLKKKMTEQMKGALSELQKELDEKNTRILELECQLTTVPKIESLQQKIEVLTTDNQNWQKKLFDTQAELQKAMEKIEEKEGEVKTSQYQQQESLRQLLQCTEEIENLKTKLIALQQHKKESEGLKIEILDYKEENSKLTEEVEVLKEKLTSSATENTDQISNMSGSVEIPVTGPSIDTVDPQIEEIVKKINNLCFDDLSYLHQQICKATCSALMKDSQQAFDVRNMETSSKLQTSDKSSDSELLQKRIIELENEFSQKKLETEKKVINLESDIRREKKLNEDLKLKLNEEQMRNIDVQNRLRLQSTNYCDVQVERDLFQKQLSYHEDRIREFVVQLEEEKARVRQHKDELQKERNCTKQMQSLLQDERQRARRDRLQDSELIENMRLKLEDAMASDRKLRFQLEQEKLAHESAKRLGSGLCECSSGSCSAFSFQGKLKVEQERSGKLEMELKREQRKAEELELAIEKERQLGLQKIEIEKDTVRQLKREIMSLEGQRDGLNSQLVNVREKLSLRQVESEALERKLHMLMEAELHRQTKRICEQEEFAQNRRALQKAQTLQNDLEQKIIDLEQEVARLKQELLDKRLKDDLVENRAMRSPSPKMSSPVLEKLRNVNTLLEQHMTENAEVALTLARLVDERQKLQSRIRELEDQLHLATKERENVVPDSVHAAFAAERAIWNREKEALKLALAQAESDAMQGFKTRDGVDTDDRVKHLFGKYLRAESYRKALVWQKKYLLVVLGGYQESEAVTVRQLAQLSGEQKTMVHHYPHFSYHRKPTTRFRTAAIVVIALSRMRYMVRRWRLGRRIGSGAILSRGYSESALSSAQSSYHGPRRRGSSTSINSLGASKVPSHPLRFELLSPPSRDQPTVRRWHTDLVMQHHLRSSESIPISSLRPSHVGEYVDRFDELQRRLGLGSTNSPP